MKRKALTLIAALALMLPIAACDVEKTGDDTYQVEVPTDEAEAAAARTEENLEAAGAEVAEEAREAGDAIEEGARDAAHATGTALEKAGKEVQEHSKPNDPN
ncbi:MAG TPA: hypothetical protein VM557_11575 [Thermoanaerobaculia bacterium]|nr:hypothetical protein [Thermoanaerobaculia bacterium]